MNQTVPAEDTQPNTPARPTPRERAQAKGWHVSHLARAALENGVSFADVEAYCAGRRVDDPALKSAWYELVNLPTLAYETPALFECRQTMRVDTALDAALMRSAMAKGIEHARLWWRGVL